MLAWDAEKLRSSVGVRETGAQLLACELHLVPYTDLESVQTWLLLSSSKSPTRYPWWPALM